MVFDLLLCHRLLLLGGVFQASLLTLVGGGGECCPEEKLQPTSADRLSFATEGAVLCWIERAMGLALPSTASTSASSEWGQLC